MFEILLLVSLFFSPLGVFLVFRRLTFFGDAVAHSSLFGVALAFIVMGMKPMAVTLGALVSVFLAYGISYWLEKKQKIAADLALAVTYSGLFASGLLLMGKEEIEIHHLFVGEMAQISPQLLWLMRAWSVVLALSFIFGWRKLWLVTLDEGFGRTLGLSMRGPQLFMAALIAVSVVLLMQVVGLVLVTSYLILPVAAALPWARGLKSLMAMTAGASLFISGVAVALSQVYSLSVEALVAVTGFVIIVISTAAKNLR